MYPYIFHGNVLGDKGEVVESFMYAKTGRDSKRSETLVNGFRTGKNTKMIEADGEYYLEPNTVIHLVEEHKKMRVSSDGCQVELKNDFQILFVGWSYAEKVTLISLE